MEDKKKKKFTESNKQKQNKKNIQEKKLETESISSKNALQSKSTENMIVVGKGFPHSKSNESGIELHVCDALAAIPFPGHNESFQEVIPKNDLQHVPSNVSFMSAQSDVSELHGDGVRIYEDTLDTLEEGSSNLEEKTETKSDIEQNLVVIEPDVGLTDINLQLKEMEKILNLREKKIKCLQNKIEECCKAKEKQTKENRGLTYQIGLLNRQLQSMYELLGKKDWQSPIDPSELASFKNKITELESVISAQDEDHKELTKKMQIISESLEAKEKELFAKNKELIDYKNRSTLEVCKLISQIDSLQNEAKVQAELLESKIQEAQSAMDDEIVNVTQKLEDQYQTDIKNAIERFHADFEKLADLPKTAIEKLLKICEPEKVDLITFQKDWDQQQALLESKIQALKSDHSKELVQVKDSYEGKICFLKAQVESLTSQLKEGKEILDIFESELAMYKTNSSMNLLKASALGDDISSLKELYMTEILSRKQVHKLQLGIFEEKVKTLTEEILYHAKNEEIHLQELENAKKMSLAFREKYEQLVADWEERVGRQFKISSEVTIPPERDALFDEFKALIDELRESEGIYEERLRLLESRTNEEKLAYLKEIEKFRIKLGQVEKFQKTQAELDESIQELIKALGVNYSKTVDALTTSHVTELSLKHLEMFSSEKRHTEEIKALKSSHQEEVEELRMKIEKLQNSLEFTEKEYNSKKTQNDEILKQNIEELSLEYLKSQGMIAIKEETEQALNNRIRELEDATKAKEENCKKELEDLSAKLIEVYVLSSAKDELAKELEEKFSESENMLEKSCAEIEKLQNAVTFMEENLKVEKKYPNHGGDFTDSKGIEKKFEKAKISGELLKTKILEVFDRVEYLEGLNQSSGDASESLEEQKVAVEFEKNDILDENRKLKLVNNELNETVTKMQKNVTEVELKNNLLMEELEDIKKQLNAAEEEKKKMFLKKKEAEEEIREMQEKNTCLEKQIHDLTNRMDLLLTELASTKGSKEEVFSISLQEVRVLYQEEQETEMDTAGTSTSTFGCQTAIEQDEPIITLLKTNESLKKENACLKVELQNKAKRSFQENVISKFKNIQQELVGVINERDELLTINERLRKERDYFKDKMENLRESLSPRQMKVMPDSAFEDTHYRSSEMKEEIDKLTEYVKVLSAKLDIMKTNNDILLSKSQEHFKQNQNLVNELEEAWSQRYEIEEQLSKVRKENALLNQHRNQLEETNRRISSLVAEGKPSVVSWIKIHETVENIVDEVLALKTSFSSSSVSAASASLEVPRTTSELQMMTETLHVQLKNKTMLCDELIIQKETLERELKSLESLIEDSPKFPGRYREEPRSFRRRQLDSLNRQSRSSPLERRQVLEWNIDCFNSDRALRNSENSHLVTLNRLKKHLEDQVEWEEAKFRENLELEIKELTTQMQTQEERLNAVMMSSEEERDLLEMKYEQEVMEISLEFAREVEKLKKLFDSGKEENSRERYVEEIERLKSYFEDRWENLKKWYSESYNKHIAQFQLPREEEVKNSEAEKGKENRHKGMLEKIRIGYEAVLEEERKRFDILLEEAKQKHDGEMIALEDFWTEKLSECETKCAILKATGDRREKSTGENQKRSKSEDGHSKIEQPCTEHYTRLEKYQTEKCKKDVQISDDKYSVGLNTKEEKPQETYCDSCVSKEPYFGRMEVKTDDDKLDIILQRDELKETVTSMQLIIAKLLAFVGYSNGNFNNTFDLDDTLYKSIYVDRDHNMDASVLSNGRLSLNLSTMIQDLTETSLLNSSDQVRFELEKGLKQIQKDAKSILALSSSDKICLKELIKRLEKKKSKLEDEVLKVENVQKEMKKEITLTKERLSQWERNLEVVSEGYGEEIVKSKQTISLTDLKDKLKMFLADHCGLPSQEINLLEEICKESEHLQQEWEREKLDLQQQIDVADKQVQSFKKFIEEQATERELEREAFDKEINQLRENLKAIERDNSLQNRMNNEAGLQNEIPLAKKSVEVLEGQLKELTSQLAESEKNKSVLEGEFQNAVKKIWSLREVIQDLEIQLADVSENESKLKKKVEKLELFIEEQDKINRQLKEELETCQNHNELHYSNHIKNLEEELVRLRLVADQLEPDSLAQFNANIRHIETVLIKKTKDLEQLHVSSANVSCSSPSEDVSIRDHIDATRCSTPDEMYTTPKLITILPLEEIDRVHEKLARHTRMEEVTIKYVEDLKMQLRNLRKSFEEVQTERDILLEKVDVYLKENSGLKARLEEQRCNAGLLQKQLNANLESQINRLETDIEKLRNLCDEKDKQLIDLKTALENTSKSLKIRETEALNKSKEENKLITTLKLDLSNAISENEKLEGKLEKMKEKLKESMTMPALIDSVLDEKNAEIDRLEKEVLRLSSEKSLGVSPMSYSSDGKKRRIRFSEPDSFSENISSISPHGSDLRNYSDSFGNFKNSLKIRQPVTCSTKVESISSIAPLHLSPRGTDSIGNFSWKTSSPIFYTSSECKSPSRNHSKSPSHPDDFQQMLKVSKLESGIESKCREISELNLEIDKLKRQLVEINQELITAKTQGKEIQNDLTTKDEEIRKLRNNEKSLLMTIESLKKNHEEEIDELQKKLKFEREKVENVYAEIKALEMKKIEIEESFLSLKQDYNEKIQTEGKTAETLLERIQALEIKNEDSEVKLTALEKEMEAAIKESEETIQKLSKEILELKDENERIQLKLKDKIDAETQVEPFHENLILETSKAEDGSSEKIHQLKAEFEKLTEAVKEKNFNKTEAYAYAMAGQKLVKTVLGKLNELSKELDMHKKKLMECSVDDLAIKVQKELLLSATLDNKLLSNIEANTGNSSRVDELAGGDNLQSHPLFGTEMIQLYKGINKKILELESEKEHLKAKLIEQQKVIRFLEERLKSEKERILGEKERCTEDAKIMELLRVNLEKALHDMKAKDKELKREKHQRMVLEKEVESLKKHDVKDWESKRKMELSTQLECQKQKIVSLVQLLDEEKKKNQQLKLSLEESQIERMTVKKAQELVESNLSVLKEQKENLIKELTNAKKLLNSRNVEIRFLKQKINVQEIDIKALSLSGDIQQQSISETSSFDNFALSPEMPSSILKKMKKLNSCVQRHVKESAEMGETLLYLSQETEQMKDVIRGLEQNEEKLQDEVMEPVANIEKQLWALEKGGLMLDVEVLRRENDTLKRDLIEAHKNVELLRLENSQIKKQKPKPSDEPNQIENEFLEDRVSHLTWKYMKTESFRKALVWQKKFLMLELRDYKLTEEKAWKKMGKQKRESKRNVSFRAVALAVVSIFRMKFIVRKWRKNAFINKCTLLDKKNSASKLTSLASALNIYSEPLNPLSYQLQNIFPQTGSRVLRTPPCRDPGPRSFSLDARKKPDCVEALPYFQGNIGTARALP